MSTSAFEAFLARIYADPDARARFKADPFAEASHAGLSPDECAAIMKIDWVGLELATRSFAKKRHAFQRRISKGNLLHLDTSRVVPAV